MGLIARRHLGNRPHQILRLDWFGQEDINAHPRRSNRVMLLATGSHHNDRHLIEARISAHAFGQPNPIEPRHEQISNDHVNRQRLEIFEGLHTITRTNHSVAMLLKHETQETIVGSVIFDKKYGSHMV